MGRSTTPPEPPNNSSKIIDDAMKEALKVPAVQAFTNLNNNKITREEAGAVVKQLSDTMGLSLGQGFACTALLLLKGASNKGAPNTLSVSITDTDGKIVDVTKHDLSYACKRTLGHEFLRRLAECLGSDISKYAEQNGLNGDLAITINNTAIAQGDPPLNNKERAWASSFNQFNNSLDTEASPRLATLMAQDYSKRFTKKKTPSSSPKPTPKEGSKKNKASQKKNSPKPKKDI